MHWREQGDRGELSAMEWYASQGAKVFVPVGLSPDCDFVADFDNRLARVQVKTSDCVRNGRFVVTTCTRGGNQSWGGVIKRLDANRYDVLFVVVGDGRRWNIPAGKVDGFSGLLLGGPKYEGFEVARGAPIAGTMSALRRDVRVVKGVAL